MKIFSLLSLLIGMISIQSWAGPSVTAGTGNPMYFCDQVHAKTYKVTNDEYEWPLCVFDGAISRYSLYQYKHGEPQLAVKAFFSKKKRPALNSKEGQISTPNPATSYCKASGGTSILVNGAEGDLRICEFPDESAIEEWTLYYGSTSEKNKKLTESLSQKTE